MKLRCPFCGRDLAVRVGRKLPAHMSLRTEKTWTEVSDVRTMIDLQLPCRASGAAFRMPNGEP